MNGVSLAGVRPWRHELAGCLHACAATLLDFHGVDPLDALGGGWSFRYLAGSVRREEYYYPTPPGRSLLAALAPYHPVSSAWQFPADEAEGWDQVRDQLQQGRPVAVAVDNYYLPFRPAYRDVHANHLLIVRGYDERRGTASVLDAVPPHFAGEIPLQQLIEARHSSNPVVHDRDRFFTGEPIGGRWLSVEIQPAEPFGPADRARIGSVLRNNLAGFRTEPTDEGCYAGSRGLLRLLRDGARRLGTDPWVRDELFVQAGAALANTAIHADWLARTGRMLDDPGLTEVARVVQRVAHHWSAVRIISARDQDGARLDQRGRAMYAAQQQALDRLERHLDDWPEVE